LCFGRKRAEDRKRDRGVDSKATHDDPL
jgi:hypothetical protein